MLNLVRRVRRRLLYNELLAQGANAFSAVLAAFVLLLVAGTQLLSWQWLAPIPAAAVAAGLYFTFRRLPSPYGAARMVDRRLALADTLSTAYYFSQNPIAPVSSEVCLTQSRQAQRMAESVDVRQAVPYHWPRTIYTMMALALVAAGLFGLRYGLNRTLDLKPPLARMLAQQFGFAPKQGQAQKSRRNMHKPLESQPLGDDAIADPDASPNGQHDGTTDTDSASQDVASQPNTATLQDAAKQAGATTSADDMDAQAEPQSGSQGEKDGQGQQAASKADQAKSSGSPQGSDGNGESSLLNKVKDAMQNLLSKMKPPQNGSNSSQQAADRNSGQQNGKGQANGKQQASNGGQKGDQAQPGDAEDEQSGEMANSTQQQGGNGKSDGQNKQPGSGAGSQDGEKNIKQAEQLAAMGKISEILGKRSANISGEATIEVEASSQQLRTAYTTRDAQHSQSGGQINRDEVPVALQPFVEQYFEQVRKQASAAAAIPTGARQ